MAQGEPGNTLIIQGAPGAGKSSIIAELENIINKGGHAAPQWREGEPRMVILSGSEAGSPDIVVSKMADIVNSQKAKDLFAEKSRFWNAALKVNLPGVGAEVPRTSETASLVPSAALSLFQRWLRFHTITLKCPIVIAIDEAQNLDGGKQLPSSRLLQDIHENTCRLPISLVLAGLSDTQAHIVSLGLTRSLEVHTIGRFTRTESVDLMQRWCEHFGLVIGAQQSRLTTYCRLADDWPRHLHCAQKALAQVIVDKLNTDSTFTGALDAVADQEWERVTKQFAQYRAEYYRDRVSPEMDDYCKLTAEVMRSLSTNTTYASIRDSIKTMSLRLSDELDNEQATKLRAHLIHQGVLQRVAKKNHFHCPIPSFRTYLIETAQSPEKDKTYSLRCGGEIYREGDFDHFGDAREWAVRQLSHLNTDQEVSLWQGAVKIDILRDAEPITACNHSGSGLQVPADLGTD